MASSSSVSASEPTPITRRKCEFCDKVNFSLGKGKVCLRWFTEHVDHLARSTHWDTYGERMNSIKGSVLCDWLRRDSSERCLQKCGLFLASSPPDWWLDWVLSGASNRSQRGSAFVPEARVIAPITDQRLTRSLGQFPHLFCSSPQSESSGEDSLLHIYICSPAKLVL